MVKKYILTIESSRFGQYSQQRIANIHGEISFIGMIMLRKSKKRNIITYMMPKHKEYIPNVKYNLKQ